MISFAWDSWSTSQGSLLECQSNTKMVSHSAAQSKC